MSLAKRYNPQTAEPQLQAHWQAAGTYHFAAGDGAPRYVIDTPPPTVSGHLHLGHVYSYSHTDFMARFWRMNGRNVLYPMGYDDNGLPTERLVERWLNVRATEIGRQAFIEKCLQVSDEAEKEYQALWQRLGLSIDWRYTYRTIDDQARRLSQLSFLDLYHQGLAYRQQAPTIWCPECRTAIAQAELEDLDRDSEYVTLAFGLDDGTTLPIATTRPELLPACVAIFVHPADPRFQGLAGRRATVPLFGHAVPVLADPQADPEKGSGAVMCCTFGDQTDVAWWFTHNLALVEAIGRDGRMAPAAGPLAGLPIPEARQRVKELLADQGLILGRQATAQSVRVHERCDTPVEYIITSQWFVRVLAAKEQFLAAGEQVIWHPEHMKARYRQWVENLSWDWCISRQRYFGVTFPVWYCDNCGEITVASPEELPVDPSERSPGRPCRCGNTSFTPEMDVMDTWATSSITPQLVGRWLGQSGFDGQPFQPVTLRPQAHEIIRTWAFYSIAKAHYHFGQLPWREVAISGWGLAPQGTGKISKSRGGGPVAPLEMIEQYSADAVRYWAASTGFGRDAVISEEKIQAGAKLVNKLWNVARFGQRFLEGYAPPTSGIIAASLAPADRWILSRTQRLIGRVTELFHNYDYATAKSETEVFFWTDLADNYLEMAKKRLYDEQEPAHEGARYALYHVLLATLKLFAPFLPYITEEIYRGLFAAGDGDDSIHRSRWPAADPALLNEAAEAAGDALVQIATAVRRYKSTVNLSLGAELDRLHLATAEPGLAAQLQAAEADIISVTRAREVSIGQQLDDGLAVIAADGLVTVAITPNPAGL
ncbi:MAG: valine--tRNA ligase [Chloroflexi bacterium]|nr:valine--tRNA ligase [Chloroflexota bacterium]MCI0580283.1 valine--tRNA ligase [Chloroflexota bacterium]MCI0643694.1 valine--tRNA ligase [Chloroflexota bacterium]MCI0729078.1 valine--tRNA ligase [Chloroflexota bacterium]